MSTYEDEHNIVANPDNATDNATTQRPHQTLSTLLADFFESSNGSSDLPTSFTTGDRTQQFARALEQLDGLPIAESLIEQLQQEKDVQGVSQEFIDALERVPKKTLKPDVTCSICTVDFVDDPHPLVVKLPCEGRHKFDLECIAPWLKIHSTCPLCRKDLLEKKKFVDLPPDDEEEEEDWEMYG